MRVIICDDSISFVEQFQKAVTSAFLQHGYSIDVRCCYNGMQLIKLISEEPVDVLFLDIEMPGMDGFFIAEQMNQLQYQPFLIFTTALDYLVYDSFQYRPFWFLRKTHLSELTKIVEKVIGVLESEQKYYEININGSLYRIPLTEILYFESDRHYVVMHTREECYRFKKKLNEIDSHLRGNYFIRSHASFLVNCRHIKLIEKNVMEMVNGEEVPISRSRLNETRFMFMKYIRSYHI